MKGMRKSIIIMLAGRWLAAVLMAVLSVVGVRAEGVYNPQAVFDIPLTYGDMVRDPSPEGPGSLIKYVDNPVDYSTGALSVSVPLYSWSESGHHTRGNPSYSNCNTTWGLSALEFPINIIIFGFYLLNCTILMWRDYLAELDRNNESFGIENLNQLLFDRYFLILICFLIASVGILIISINDLV